MPTIVISYRRADAAGTAGRMFDRLRAHFGDGSVFMDIDSIPAGTNFRQHIRGILTSSDIVLAVIGPRWMGDGGRKRLGGGPVGPTLIIFTRAVRQRLVS